MFGFPFDRWDVIPDPVDELIFFKMVLAHQPAGEPDVLPDVYGPKYQFEVLTKTTFLGEARQQ